MELTQLGFLEELLAPRRDTWNTFSSGFSDIFPTAWTFDSFEDNPPFLPLNPPFSSFPTPLDHRFECPYTNEAAAAAYPFFDGFTVPELDSSYTRNEDSAHFPPQESNPSMEDEDLGFLGTENQSLGETNNACKIEEQATEVAVFNMGVCGEKKPKSKKLEGQPSKNLMAERRRRKRLNDRLSMLRSIVPKISKMDRTSILGDTIDYMKELLERIGKLQEERTEEGIDQMNLLGNTKDLKPNEVMVRNSPKFDVEKREQDTKISICCATRTGLLLSTVNTLEALGLEIQQCVISSFNDFSMQASCSEVGERRTSISPEEIKQALFRNAVFDISTRADAALLLASRLHLLALVALGLSSMLAESGNCPRGDDFIVFAFDRDHTFKRFCPVVAWLRANIFLDQKPRRSSKALNIVIHSGGLSRPRNHIRRITQSLIRFTRFLYTFTWAIFKVLKENFLARQPGRSSETVKPINPIVQSSQPSSVDSVISGLAMGFARFSRRLVPRVFMAVPQRNRSEVLFWRRSLADLRGVVDSMGWMKDFLFDISTDTS
ncbi:transcription factor bHLH93-like isoform X1 [Senna tora]|uniref:Transcription factor bHLH93-like isoform X1 n=1 Tax=Senna tora TaxID=362788 RepID=A0A834TWB7_9FABA|nr:transcription factor bHLH93-like isoform X1 [Senna tora]